MSSQLRQLVLPGLHAVRMLWKPFVLLQLAGLALVVAYFQVEPVTRFCESIGAVKARWGPAFAALTMPIACGIVPELFKLLAGVDRTWTRRRASLALHNMALFCVAGMVIDQFYTLLNHAFRDNPSPWVVPAKVLIDMLIYSPVIGVPLIVGAYLLRRTAYRPLAALRQIGPAWYAREVAPVLVVCWAYWFPMSALMYTMPPKLTFVYGLFASAASATLMTAVAGRGESKIGDAHA